MIVVLASSIHVAAQQLPSDIDHRNALLHAQLGDELLRAERFDRAVEEFNAAIRLDRFLMNAHYGLGQAYMALRRYTEAIRAYLGCREAFQTLAGLIVRNDVEADRRRDDEIRELQNSIGEIQSGQLKIATGREVMVARLEARMHDLDRMKQRGTTDFDTPSELSLALGSAYFRSGDLPSAEREWKAATAVNSRLGEAHNNLAALYAMTGRKQQAEEALKQAEKSGFQVNPKLKSDIRAMR
jgi:tetratricopeptide (TPR) repeat protein